MKKAEPLSILRACLRLCVHGRKREREREEEEEKVERHRSGCGRVRGRGRMTEKGVGREGWREEGEGTV